MPPPSESSPEALHRVSDAAARPPDGRMGSKVRPHLALLIPAMIGSLILAVLAWIAGETYAAVTETQGIALLDQPVLDTAIALRQPWLNSLVNTFTTIGGPILTPVIATVVVVWLCAHWKSLLPATLMLAATLGSLAVTVVGKRYVGRLRPDHALAVPPNEFSPSFPSGHALNSVVVAGVLAYLLLRRLKRPAARIAVVVTATAYSLLMGLSRVYLGHHWLTDVITGWALGLGWLCVVIVAHRIALAIKRRPRDRPTELPPATAIEQD